jgi:ADP-heptose:LPS heptosyltransferase
LYGLAHLRRRLERIPRLLIIRLRSLGDSILALPLVESLHTWRPALEIDLLVEEPYAAVFFRHPAVHEVLRVRSRTRPAEAGWGRFRTCIEVRRRRYGAVLNLHGGTTSLLFTVASGSSVRIGQQKYRQAWAYNARIPPPVAVWNRSGLHTFEDQLALLPWVGLPVQDPPRGRLYLDQAACDRIRGRLSAAGVDATGYLLIHPTATLATKQWKSRKFAELADRLVELYSLPVIFTSAPSETQVLLDVGRHAHFPHRYWSDLDLPDLFALIASSRLFVGNDSGPAHAAAALGRPIVVIWGSSDYRAWHPRGTEFEAVRQNLPCMPCPGYTCAVYGEPRCIDDIAVGTVLEACGRFLKRG